MRNCVKIGVCGRGVKIVKNGGFCPALTIKNRKKWRISAGLRVFLRSVGRFLVAF